jgi:hypothetical protein
MAYTVFGIMLVAVAVFAMLGMALTAYIVICIFRALVKKDD